MAVVAAVSAVLLVAATEEVPSGVLEGAARSLVRWGTACARSSAASAHPYACSESLALHHVSTCRERQRVHGSKAWTAPWLYRHTIQPACDQGCRSGMHVPPEAVHLKFWAGQYMCVLRVGCSTCCDWQKTGTHAQGNGCKVKSAPSADHISGPVCSIAGQSALLQLSEHRFPQWAVRDESLPLRMTLWSAAVRRLQSSCTARRMVGGGASPSCAPLDPSG